MNTITEKNWIGLKIVEPYFFIPNNKTLIIDPINLHIKNTSGIDYIIFPEKTVSSYIKLISLLPDIVLNQNGFNNIKLDKKIDKGLIEMIRTYQIMYKFISLWLERKHNNIIYPEIYKEPYVNYEIFAIQSLELLKLIQNIFDKERYIYLMNEMFSKNNYVNELKIGDELIIWFSCEYSSLEKTFNENGIFKLIEQEGRVRKSEKMIKIYNNDYNNCIENNHNIKIDKNPPKINSENTYYHGKSLIEFFGKIISKNDSKFNDIYLKYCRVQKKAWRKIRNNGHLKSFYLNENNQVVEYKKHKRGKGKK